MTKPAVLCYYLLFIIAGCENVGEQKETLSKPANKSTGILKEKWHWDSKTNQNEDAGYAQVVKVGNTLYISGIPTHDLSPVGITRVYDALEKCLNTFGASSQNVVKENLYTTDIEQVKKYNAARKAFYKGDFPAATWVQVTRLYEADSKLEVELIAQLEDTNQ
ncbi:RidA family protein [Dyadobacter subterraneus]|uniref:RidA family protein n=1 Tax=Dyadobacter subterraneus TaxID=2773304 RepID=A0ABR9WHK4_9BACT|nr:RidA family protein [Dyadobacter subterraneus]MBE9463836.1 RidA family protein [Dyadobacter subterraneus]